jgi:hypothetical protein
MTNRRLAYIGAIAALVLALALSLQAVSARSIYSLKHIQPNIYVTVRISQARVYRQPRLGERITVVIVLRGTGLRPGARLRIKNDVIVRVSTRQQAVANNGNGSPAAMRNSVPEAEEDTTMTEQTDNTGVLLVNIPVELNGPDEAPGTANAFNDTVTVSDSTGQPLANTNAAASVTSN